MSKYVFWIAENHLFPCYNTHMWALRLRRLFGLSIFLISALILTWGLWPQPQETRQVVIPAADLIPQADPKWAEERNLVVSWPGWLRIGDAGVIHLDFLPAEQTDNEAAAISEPPGAAALVARLELPAVRHFPPGDTSQALVAGRPLRFTWTVYADRDGEMTATLWLHLVQPSAASASVRTVVSAQRLEIRAASLLGISGPWARAMGVAGILIGGVLGLDGVATHLIKAIKSDIEKVTDNHYA